MSEKDLLYAGLALLVAGWGLLANRRELARLERWSWVRLGLDFKGLEEFTVKTTSAAGVLSLVAAAFVLLSAFES
jgi:hypothetical protein